MERYRALHAARMIEGIEGFNIFTGGGPGPARPINTAALTMSHVRQPARASLRPSAPPSIPASAFDDYLDAIQERADLEKIPVLKVRRMRRSDYD